MAGIIDARIGQREVVASGSVVLPTTETFQCTIQGDKEKITLDFVLDDREDFLSGRSSQTQ
jgi:hypothetical protein